MYRYVPQKRRSRMRVKIGCAVYSCVRYFFWIKNWNCFAKKSRIPADKLKTEFPFVVFSHSSPLYRNLSEVDRELQNGKVNNLSIAVKTLSPVILAPGKIFSYWKLIGNPTSLKGYKKGMMLVNGRPVPAVGGGLCALSNLIYWMTLHTPLSVRERFRHSYDVFPDSNRVLPFGSGATCVYNYRDLMIKNESQETFALFVWIENDRLRGEWRAKNPSKILYEVYQKDHWFTNEAPGIYLRHNRIFRKAWALPLSPDGERTLIEDVEITENHALMMYEPLLDSLSGESK